MTEPRLFQRSDLTFHVDTVLMIGAVVSFVLSAAMMVTTSLLPTTQADMLHEVAMASAAMFYNLLQCLAVFAAGAALRMGAIAMLALLSDDKLSQILGASQTERARKREAKRAIEREVFYRSIEPE